MSPDDNLPGRQKEMETKQEAGGGAWCVCVCV